MASAGEKKGGSKALPKKRKRASRNPRCFMDISIAGEPEGRIVVELFAAVVPKTAENFRALCTGEKGIGPKTGAPLHYKGSKFHCILQGFIVLGGDISQGDGRGGESIYGQDFEAENFTFKHRREGMLSMANYGPKTHASQFFITTNPAAHLDGRNVVFGKVLKGMGLVRLMEHVPVGDFDRPVIQVTISDCGEIPQGTDDGVVNFFKDGDSYPDWPSDLDKEPTDVLWWIDAVESATTFGNEYYKKQDYKMALRKYQKALRYLDVCCQKEEADEEKILLLLETKSEILTSSYACKLKLEDLKGTMLGVDIADGETNEILALYEASRECVWLRSLAKHIRSCCKLNSTCMYCSMRTTLHVLLKFKLDISKVIKSNIYLLNSSSHMSCRRNMK